MSGRLVLRSTSVPDPDAALLDALRAGDEDAFATLVSRYHMRLLRFAESLVVSRAVAGTRPMATACCTPSQATARMLG